MKDVMPTASRMRRPADRRENRPARSATANISPPSTALTDQERADRAQHDQWAALRFLHLVALLALPLSLYLVYAHGENYLYRGLLAVAVIGNLLILARIDSAQAQQLKKELQSLHTDNQTNHE